MDNDVKTFVIVFGTMVVAFVVVMIVMKWVTQ